MYRNCKLNTFSNCNCNCNCCNKQYEVLEDVCDNVMPLMESNYDECACGFDEEESLFPANYTYGHCYVPDQKMTKTFMPCEGLKVGTIFPELVSPYLPMQSMAEINYLKNLSKEGCRNV